MGESRLKVRGYWWFVILALGLIALKYSVVDKVPNLFRHPKLEADGALSSVEHPLHQAYADGLDLIGYDQSGSEMPADGTLRVDLYWTVRKKPSRRYQTVVHLVGPNGFRWSWEDSFRPRDYQDPPPTTSWTPSRYALDSHEVEPLPGTPPGRYDIVLTVFDRETLVPLSVLSEGDQPTAPELTLGQVILTSPQNPADPSRLGIRRRLDEPLGPVTLLGANFDRDEVAPGDPIWVTTFWHVDEQPEEDLALHLALVAPDGSSVTGYTCSPVAPWHPTSAWRSDDVWRGQHMFRMPSDLDMADYTWTLSLVPSLVPPLSLSQLSVTAPDRTFAQPAVEIENRSRLGDVATLVGANVRPGTTTLRSGEPITVTLVWRAEAETDISYRVFLHLIGPGGELVTQSDGIPADWTRPTTGWVTGEYVTDPRVLSVPIDAPAGTYQLQAGMYAPNVGRLPTADGTDAVILASSLRLQRGGQ